MSITVIAAACAGSVLFALGVARVLAGIDDRIDAD